MHAPVFSRRQALAAGCAGLLAAACPAPSARADGGVPLVEPGISSWPSFRNGRELLGVAHGPLSEKLELLWTYKAGDQIFSTAAIVGDFVYAASLSGELFCLSRTDGKRIWTYRSKTSSNPKEFIPGFKASPAVTADTVYVGDEDGMFHAVHRGTGEKKWTFATDGEIFSSASVLPDRVLFGSYDSNLYCLKADTGGKLWQFTTENKVNCTPAVSGGSTFIAGCDEHLRVIDIETGRQQTDIPLETYLIASPAVMGDVLYVGTYASEVVAVDWKNAKRVWTYSSSDREFPYHSSAAVTDRFVVVGSNDKRLHCIDRQTGAKAWVFATRGKIEGSPVIVGDRVFVGSADGNLYGLHLATGQEFWRFTDSKGFSASPAVGEGCLVIGSLSRDGALYCFGTPTRN